MSTEAKPFLKWAGGKGQLLSQLDEHLPGQLRGQAFTYIEPFVGGGAMLFHMLRKFPNITHAVINDINPHLVTAYRVIKQQPDDLIRRLSALEQDYFSQSDEEAKKGYYLNVRKIFNETVLDDVDRTKYLMFLNRTCFNGLYRVNAKGRFNVPFGRNLHPTICNADTILADSEALNRVDITILNGDFELTEYEMRDGLNFFYFDPPYRPLNATSSFNSYAKEDFNDDEQIRLRDFCARLNNLPNVKWMLSNADCSAKNPEDTFFEEIYADFHIHRVYASRAINANPSKRGKLTELLIKNYEFSRMKQLSLNLTIDSPTLLTEDNDSSIIYGGLFIALYDEDSLKLYLDKGLYGFLMKPVMTCKPNSRSRYYAILADYACSREGTDVFFFLKRKIVYGGKIYGNKDIGSFYLNGKTSPLGRKADAELFWDESERKNYIATDEPGVFKIRKDGADKAQPFMFQFFQNADSGKYIISDDLYFE